MINIFWVAWIHLVQNTEKKSIYYKMIILQNANYKVTLNKKYKHKWQRKVNNLNIS